MIDTNVTIQLRDGDPLVSGKIAALKGRCLLSIVTVVELEGGVYRDPIQAEARRSRLDAILSALPILDFDVTCANAYRQIVSKSGYSRRKLLDRMIAAQAIVHHAHLITMNADDFRDIQDLRLIEWKL